MNVLRNTSILLENGNYPEDLNLDKTYKFSFPEKFDKMKVPRNREFLLIPGRHGKAEFSPQAKVQIIDIQQGETADRTILTCRVTALYVPAGIREYACEGGTSKRADQNYGRYIGGQVRESRAYFTRMRSETLM